MGLLTFCVWPRRCCWADPWTCNAAVLTWRMFFWLLWQRPPILEVSGILRPSLLLLRRPPLLLLLLRLNITCTLITCTLFYALNIFYICFFVFFFLGRAGFMRGVSFFFFEGGRWGNWLIDWFATHTQRHRDTLEKTEENSIWWFLYKNIGWGFTQWSANLVKKW